MCTCGIDIATQQATPATQSSACARQRQAERALRRRAGVGPRRDRGRRAPAAGRASTAPAAASSRRRRFPCRCRSGASRRSRRSAARSAARPRRRGSCRWRRSPPRCRAGDEPERGVGDQRREGRRAADQAEQQAVRRSRRRGCRRSARRRRSRGQADRADQDRQHHAAPVGQATHQDAADAEADHQQRVGQRRRRRGRRRTPSAPTAAPPRRRTCAAPIVISARATPRRIQAWRESARGSGVMRVRAGEKAGHSEPHPRGSAARLFRGAARGAALP